MREGQGAAGYSGDLILYKSPDVIVYTMGKVGSSSISLSLRASSIKCFDLHRLEPRRIQELLVRSLQASDHPTIAPHLLESAAALNTLKHRRISGKITKLICAIREPISRNISAVFENMPESLKSHPDEISQRLSAYSPLVPDRWFVNDFQPVTGINVLNMEHDRERGAFHFRNDLFDVLLLKLESPDGEKAAAISNFLGANIELLRANEAKNKWYAEIYSQHLRNAREIGNDFARRCLDLDYFQRFYSELEIKSISEHYGIRV